jgi:tRNA(fMet)-specific endonuclease VapC
VRDAKAVEAVWDARTRRPPIGAYDTMIAGQAARRGLTVVTADTGDFARVDDLMWEDWAR